MDKNLRRRWQWPALGLVVLVLVSGPAAFGCVPQPLVTVSPRASGPPGTQVTVNATSVAGNVEIRWNALDGPQLGTGLGPSFSTPVTIPETADGLYTIVVVERLTGGSAGSAGRAEFLVSGADPTGSTAPPGRPAATSSAPTTSSGTSGGQASSGLLLAGSVALLVGGALGGAALVRRRARRARPAE